MKSFLILDKQKLHYSDQGKGKVLVLLHGYLESMESWGEFANLLSEHFRVICFDIPGHGQSDELGELHNMDLLAKRIFKALSQLKISKCFMMGHSMGGYLTLMFHDLYPELLSGFSLFHSHPFSDSEETRSKRLREIAFVKSGKKDLIAKFNIPNAFAQDNLLEFKDSVQRAINIALQTSEKGIIANLYAMMNRPDLSKSLEKSKKPFLYIVGKKDNYIDIHVIVPRVSLPKNSQLVVLENSGHMGFVEETDIAIKSIKSFLIKLC